jgi:hypothetical protein
MKELKVRITFISPVLGSQPSDPDIHRTYIASKAPNAPKIEEEVAAVGVDAVTKKGMTIFPRDKDGNIVLWDYQIRGFFKAAAQSIHRSKDKDLGPKTLQMKAFKKIIDQNIFVFGDKLGGRQITIDINGEVGELQRSLRANTPQGDIVSIAHSEMINEGSTAEFTIKMLGNEYEDAVKEWLDYGVYNGFGQWRNASYGRFTWEEI